MIIIFAVMEADQPEKEADESGVAKKHLEDCGDSDRSLDLAHPHLVFSDDVIYSEETHFSGTFENV